MILYWLPLVARLSFCLACTISGTWLVWTLKKPSSRVGSQTSNTTSENSRATRARTSTGRVFLGLTLLVAGYGGRDLQAYYQTDKLHGAEVLSVNGLNDYSLLKPNGDTLRAYFCPDSPKFVVGEVLDLAYEKQLRCDRLVGHKLGWKILTMRR